VRCAIATIASNTKPGGRCAAILEPRSPPGPARPAGAISSTITITEVSTLRTLSDEPPPPTQPEPTVVLDERPDCGLIIVPPDPDVLPDPDDEPPEIPAPTEDYELVAA
jgi:hypothetical protein